MISVSRANQSQAKFKSAVGGNLLQSWVNLTIAVAQKLSINPINLGQISEKKCLSTLTGIFFLLILKKKKKRHLSSINDSRKCLVQDK